MKFTILALAALTITTSSFASSMVCRTVISEGGEEVLKTNFASVPKSRKVVLVEYKEITTTIEKSSPRIYLNGSLVAGGDSFNDLELSASVVDSKNNQYEVEVECSL